MDLNPRHWGWRSLVGSWAAYWVGLAGVTLGPFAVYVWKLAQVPGKHGTVSLNMGDDGFHLTALRDGAAAWSGSVGLGTLALWVGIPPLLIWLLWLMMRPSPAERAQLRDEANLDALSSGAQDEWTVRDASTRAQSPIERRK
jgi:hypothetical protein